ncbi:MAG: glycosyltransferase [Rhizobiaceae bacterium]
MANARAPKASISRRVTPSPQDDAARVTALEKEVADLARQLRDAKDRSANLHLALSQSEKTILALMTSSSWRLTAPVRAMSHIFRDPRNMVGYVKDLLRGRTSSYYPFPYNPLFPQSQRDLLTPEKLTKLRALFDEDYYLEQNPEVELAGFEPFRHFMEIGRFRGLKATRETHADIDALRGRFNNKYYALSNPEVVAAGVKPFEHYLHAGRWEGREGWPPPKLPGQHQAAWGSDYQHWIERRDANESSLAALAEAVGRMPNKPLISVVMPVYNTPEALLRDAIDSVAGQIYPHWELCIADDASTEAHIRPMLEDYAARDPRIKIVCRERNGHISEATNSAFALATGEWIALLDHDDLLRSDSLAEVAMEIVGHPEAQLIYSDEDKLGDDGLRYDPYFKPDYSRELFRSQNYFNHLTVHRAENIRAVDGWRKGFEGSQDYDLNLRVLERIEPATIRHIPKVLYHWRAAKGSVAASAGEKTYAFSAGMRALQEHVERLKLPARVEPAPDTPFYRVKLDLPSQPPLVSLIIPAKDKVKLTRGCISSILEKTTYPNYEILLVDNGSVEAETLAYNAKIGKNPKVRVISYTKPFNYSAINNFAVGQANGALVGLVNNDIEVMAPDWLSEMVSWAAQPDIGCVGAKLYYADETIQHAGCVLGVGGVADHPWRGRGRHDPCYFGQASIIRNCSAVTAACLVVRKSVFEQVGGLDEVGLQIAFNDIDFCMRVAQAGYANVYTPYAELYHLESQSRGYEDNPEKIARFNREIRNMRRRWGSALDSDPFYSVNLSRKGPPYALAI